MISKRSGCLHCQPYFAVTFNRIFVILISAIIFASLGSICEAEEGENTQVSGARSRIFVAPDGDDANPGTWEKPLATLEAAQDAVREVVAKGLESDLVVDIQEGVYEIEDTLRFGPEDSGSEQYAVIYAAAPGAQVVVSGGGVIDGWEEGENDLWTAHVPDVEEGERYFRNLWVDDSRAFRARRPNVDEEDRYLRGFEYDEDLTSKSFTFHAELVEEWENLEDVEVVVFGTWEIMRKRFAQVDPETGVAHMEGPHTRPGSAMAGDRAQEYLPRGGRRGNYYFENAIEFLDQPGEWYLDRETGVLSYLPRPEEDMTDARVVAPRLECLIDVRGTDEEPVRNLHFQGIEFKHTDWILPEGGYMGRQACWYTLGVEEEWLFMDAAIRFEDARDCSVTDGVLAHMGGCGIEYYERCESVTVAGNHIHDISGNGINIQTGSNEEEDVPKNSRVENNHIHNCGVGYYGAVGIRAGITQGTVIANNHIHDLPYTGISLGWQWNQWPSAARDNVIERNHVHDVMQRVYDGAGIYTLGKQPGTVIRNNLIHDVSGDGENNGIFLDQGSKGYRIVGNAVNRISPGRPLRRNLSAADWHEFEDNMLCGQDKP